MMLKTEGFDKAYKAYFDAIHTSAKKGFSILEVGGGAFPSFQNIEDYDYTIVDPDGDELSKGPECLKKINSTVQELSEHHKFDLIVSKMVLEHVAFPDQFHSKVHDLLIPDGTAIHFFACRHSIPAFFNRFLPERLGDVVLKLLKARNLDNSPKYPAFYRRTMGHSKNQIQYFESLGYTVESYSSFVGHKYLKNIPVANHLEKIVTTLLAKLQLKSMATVALVILSKKKDNAL